MGVSSFDGRKRENASRAARTWPDLYAHKTSSAVYHSLDALITHMRICCRNMMLKIRFRCRALVVSCCGRDILGFAEMSDSG